MTFDVNTDSFPIAYEAGPASSAYHSTYGTRLEYPSAATFSTYGTGCGGTISASYPYAGNEYFTVRLAGAPPTSPAVLLMSLGSGAIDLGFLGAPGCFLNLDPTPGLFFGQLPSTPDGSGNASAVISLPDVPLVVGDLYFQWGFFDFGTIPVTLKTTRGGKAQIR